MTIFKRCKHFFFDCGHSELLMISSGCLIVNKQQPDLRSSGAKVLRAKRLIGSREITRNQTSICAEHTAAIATVSC
jgi:hypothetical protein